MKQAKLNFGGQSGQRSAETKASVNETNDSDPVDATVDGGQDDNNAQEHHGQEDPASRGDTNDSGSADEEPQNTTEPPDPHKDAGTTAEQDTKAKPSGQKSTTHLRVVNKVGDIFDAPPNTVIIHACNCLGHWGAGIAAAFKTRYPQAYKQHAAYCKSPGKQPAELLATAQLIPPCEIAYGKDGVTDVPHYVACLFTSKRFGRKRDKPAQIIKSTGPAMKHLMSQIKSAVKAGQPIAGIRTCQINAGMFAVPWEKSKEAMERIQVEGLNESLTTITAYVRG